ncbi:hypothetical protein F5Y18DRAFT_444015 [Xylariaceae sp. FL1019]|nr:hypothetical protein F5Y18DRAFT_444015 [Xylariaceae sp. FL1019]
MAKQRSLPIQTLQERKGWDLVPTLLEGPRKPECGLCDIADFKGLSPLKRLGPSTLAEHCIRVAADHLNDLDTHCLDCLPPHLVIDIWQFVINDSRALLSFRAWKLFTNRLSRDKDTAKYMSSCSSTRWFSTVPGDLAAPLSEYLSPLASDSFEFLTHLTIAGLVSIETHDLLQLSQFRNLAILELIEPVLNPDYTQFPRVSDSVVREWARQPDSFPLLRLLRIWGDRFTTTQSFQYLDAFPSLVLYDVAGEKADWEGAEEFSASWILSTCLFGQITQQQPGDPKAEREYWGPKHKGDFWDTIKHSFEDRVAADVNHALSTPGLPGLANIPPQWKAPLYEEQLHDNGLLFFLLYCHIGAIISNRDLRDYGVTPWEHLTSLNKTVVPALPIASLTIGTRPATEDCEDAFEVHHTFIRNQDIKDAERIFSSNPISSQSDDKKRNASSSSSSRPKKRRDVADLLESFK